MALAPPLPPADHAAARVDWLSRLAGEIGPSPRAMGPLPVYAVGASDLATGHLLERARLVLWRSLVLGANERLFALDLAPPAAPGLAWSLGGLASGPPTEALRARLAEAADHAGEGDELRLLVSASPPFEALWLHGPGRDMLVPTQDHPPALIAGAAYAAAEILAALTPAARRTLAEGHAESN